MESELLECDIIRNCLNIKQRVYIDISKTKMKQEDYKALARVISIHFFTRFSNEWRTPYLEASR